MQGNTAYFFQSLFMAFTLLGIFFLSGLVYMKVKKVETVIKIDEKAINIYLFTIILFILAMLLGNYGFGGIHE